jgi:hypothetical protein
MLALPADQLHGHCWHRFILRNAMQGLLPDDIRSREDMTSLNSVDFLPSLWHNQVNNLEKL